MRSPIAAMAAAAPRPLRFVDLHPRQLVSDAVLERRAREGDDPLAALVLEGQFRALEKLRRLGLGRCEAPWRGDGEVGGGIVARLLGGDEWSRCLHLTRNGERFCGAHQ